jgi:hypothetical protein
MLIVDCDHSSAIIPHRHDEKQTLVFIDANPNPIFADGEDLAVAAGKAALSYPQLTERIVRQGMKTVRD